MSHIGIHGSRGGAQCQGGFTAIELMTTLAILAVIAALALPSFQPLIERYRMHRVLEDFTATLYFSRAEAIRRGGNVTLHKAAADGCSTSGAGDWGCGWLVFADTNGNGTLDDDEEVIQAANLPRGVAVSMRSPRNALMFDRWGMAGGAGFFSVILRPLGTDADTPKQSCLRVSSGGRIVKQKGASACSA